MILYTVLLCVVYVRYFIKGNTKFPENYGKISRVLSLCVKQRYVLCVFSTNVELEYLLVTF